MQPKRIFSADLIRTLAIFGVLLSHITIAVSGRPDFFGGISWWFSLILGTLSRAAIPFFVMLSGYLLIPKHESFDKYLRRIKNRILIPLVFWTLIYTYAGNKISNPLSPLYTLASQLYSSNVFHLYYLEITIGLYVAAAFIGHYFRNSVFATKLRITVFFLILGAAQAALQYISGSCTSDNIFTISIPYIGIFMAGYVLANAPKIAKKSKLLAIISVTFFVITIALNYAHSYLLFNFGKNILNGTGCISDYTNYFLSVNVMLMSIPAFIVLINMNFDRLSGSVLGKFIRQISQAAFGIYLVHLLFIQFFDSKLHLFDPISPAWLYLVIKFAVIFLVSFGTVLLIKKVPILRRVIGEK